MLLVDLRPRTHHSAMDLLEVLPHLRHKPFHGGGEYTLHLDLNLACRRVPCNETSFQCIVGVMVDGFTESISRMVSVMARSFS